jgi:hypothetical protein
MKINKSVIIYSLLFLSSFIGLTSYKSIYSIDQKENWIYMNYKSVKNKYLVRNKAELLNAIKTAKNNDLIYINDSAKIDLSDNNKIVIPGGVTLMSGRDQNSSKGALLYTKSLDAILFIVGGENVHFLGLRISGPDTLKRTIQMAQLLKEGGHKSYYSIPVSRGIQSYFSRTEISNCEIWGWSHAAVFLKSNNNINCDSNYIHDNYIHHNQRSGLGYGICLDNASALIERNIFDWNRHSIAGTGRPFTSYEARNNVVKENSSSHAFDMHGGKDRKDNTDIAGSKILIHDNTFYLTSKPDVVIRGIPLIDCLVFNNIFSQKDSSLCIKQVNAIGNMKVYNNKYGVILK